MAENYVDFFKLAYLIEIAIVINLAFRELKLHNLNEKVKVEIQEITKKYASYELNENPFYLTLISLIDKEAESKVKNSPVLAGMWKSEEKWRSFYLGIFYPHFIRNGRALNLTQYSVVLSILILILITAFYSWPQELEILWCRELSEKWAKEIFLFLGILITAMCLLPLFFIYLTGACEIFLFGDPTKGSFGRIKQLDIELDRAKDSKTKEIFETHSDILKKILIHHQNNNE